MSLSSSLAQLGGARRGIVENAPSDKSFYVAFALLMIFTATIGGGSMCIALLTIGAPWPLAVAVALVWGTGVLLIDRILTITLHKPVRAGQIVIRLLIAGIIGTIVSTPVTLQIFAQEVNAQVVRDQVDARDEFDAQLEQMRTAEAEVQAEITALQATVLAADQIDPSKDAKYATALARLEAAQKDYDQAVKKWAAKGDPYGILASATATLDHAKTREATARRGASGRLANANATARDQATAELQIKQDELDRRIAARHDLENSFEEVQHGGAGLAARITALSEVGDRWPVWGHVPHAFVWALFFLIEMLPVATKWLWVTRKESSVHDELVALDDARNLDVAANDIALDRQVRETDYLLGMADDRARRARG